MHHPDYYERKVCDSMHAHTSREVPLDIKMLDKTGEFEGYASVFDVVDNHRDKVVRGAFRRSLKDRKEPVKLLWQHRMDEPIGVIAELREDMYGLYIKGRLLLDVERAQEAYSLVKSGVVKGLSIGYRPVKYTYEPETGIRELQQVELVEISLVTSPANDAAEVNEVKAERTQNADLAVLADALKYAIAVSY